MQKHLCKFLGLEKNGFFSQQFPNTSHNPPRRLFEKMLKLNMEGVDGYEILADWFLFIIRSGVYVPFNWHAVFELNYEGAPDFWGRDVHDVER